MAEVAELNVCKHPDENFENIMGLLALLQLGQEYTPVLKERLFLLSNIFASVGLTAISWWQNNNKNKIWENPTAVA